MVTCLEPSQNPEQDELRVSVIWAAHGVSLYRCTHEQLCAELPEERAKREKERPEARTQTTM